MKKTISKLSIVALLGGFFVVGHYANADDLGTTTTIANQAPVFSVTVSDGASNTGAAAADPTDATDDVDFTATAFDVNGDQYYLALCKTNAVTVGNDAAPTCDGGSWAISGATNSAAQASVSYTTTGSESNSDCDDGSSGTNGESCGWFAFVCDKLPTGSGPACSSGDQGAAIGTVTFTGIPADEDVIVIDSITYEFDTANDGLAGGGTEVDTSASSDASDVAAALVAAEAGTSSNMIARAGVVYVYADAAGTAGSSIAMSETTDAGGVIALSGATLTGGDDDNASPFAVNHAGTFGTIAIGDTAGGTGTIEPGDTIHFRLATAQLADEDDVAAQDTINMYICTAASTGFDYSANTCTGGSLICSATSVNPTSGNADCNDSGSQAPVPTAHGSVDVDIYVEDNHDLPLTGTSTQSYTVQDVVPTFVSNTINSPASPLSISAGGTQTVTFTVRVNDDNGVADIDSLSGTFFDDAAEATTCYADNGNAEDHNDCYHDTSCTKTGVDTTDADFECQVTARYNSNASTDWEVIGFAVDGNGTTNMTQSNVNFEISALLAIDVTQTTIAYGTVALGGTSSGQETSVGNVGNQVADFTVDGDDMCTDYPTCSGSTIDKAQQKWHQTTQDFNWDNSEANPGPWILKATSGSGTETSGCVNRDIQVRNDGTSSTENNESIYWKIRIPAVQAAGSYTGQNTFSVISSTSCSGTLN